MAEPNRITVITDGGVRYDLTPFGRSYTEASELITREDRAASGKLRRDIIAEKKTFSLSYEAIDTKGLELYEGLFKDHANEVLTLETVRKDKNGADRTFRYSVLMRPFSRQRGARGLWQGVTVEFVEV
jgi:hypothetical protein